MRTVSRTLSMLTVAYVSSALTAAEMGWTHVAIASESVAGLQNGEASSVSHPHVGVRVALGVARQVVGDGSAGQGFL